MYTYSFTRVITSSQAVSLKKKQTYNIERFFHINYRYLNAIYLNIISREGRYLNNAQKNFLIN